MSYSTTCQAERLTSSGSDVARRRGWPVGRLWRTRPRRRCGGRSQAAAVWLCVGWLWLAGAAWLAGAELPDIRFERKDGQVVILAGESPVATYVYRDPDIPRPYFAHLFAPGGIQVSRHHPPRQGQDAMDHDKLHPGIWLAFGDLNGHDSWRLKASVRHEMFVEPPSGGAGRGGFAVRDSYLPQGAEAADLPICSALSRYTIVVRPHGYLLVIDTAFTTVGGREFHFGDQEEMGLGIRVATPLSVRRGGRMVDSERRVNEQQIWGKKADWCDYSGEIADRRVGMTLMVAPPPFPPARFHARDYGFIAANPFAEKAFTGGPARVTPVRPGESLRLRFGVLLHAAAIAEPVDLAAEYAAFSRIE